MRRHVPDVWGAERRPSLGSVTGGVQEWQSAPTVVAPEFLKPYPTRFLSF